MHDAGQPDQRRVATEVERVDEDLEGALVAAVGELGAGGVEGARGFDLGHGQDLVGRDVADLGLGVDEATEQRRAGDPVGLRALAGDPLHAVPPAGVAASGTSWTGRNRRHRVRS